MAASTKAVVDLKQEHRHHHNHNQQQQQRKKLEEEEEEEEQEQEEEQEENGEKEYVIREKELLPPPKPTTTTKTVTLGGEFCRSLENLYDGRSCRNSTTNYSDDVLGGGGGGGGVCSESNRRLSGWGAETREVASADDVLSSLHSKQEKGETGTLAAVLRASEEGNLDNLKELSDTPGHTVDLSTANKHGETAVHMAASGGHVDVLKFLQDKGVNINIKDKQGDTAVYWAARQGHLEAIRCLHEAGLPLDSQNKSGETALHVAARYGHAHVVDFLCQADASSNVIDSLGETPLHSAAWHGYSHIVHTLCQHGAALDMRNKEGETALHCAAVRGNVDCVRILLDHDAPLNKVDKRGSTALHLACHRQQTKIAIMLLHAGCEMEALDRETGESALHAACREGMVEVVDTLCDLGCSLTTPTTEGLTPLHVAVRAGHIDVVRSLLMAGAPPDTPNKDGLTGAIIALAQGYVDIAELLSKVKGEKGAELIRQLEEGTQPVSRVKLKLLGCTGVGKTLLLESLKAGFLGSFFRTRLVPTSDNNVTVSKGKMVQQFSLPSPISYTVANPTYTKGVDIQQIHIAGAGEFSVWDFSGYEPYYMLYDQFLGDVHGVHLVVFSLVDPPEEQLAQVIFWLNFIKARVPPAMPIGYCGRLRLRPRVLLVATHADHLSPGASKDSRGEYVTPPELSSLHQRVKEVFQHDLSLSERLFLLDATLPASPDLKALKAALVREKHEIVQSLPKPSGLVEATVAQLPTWRREKGDYPVVTWRHLGDMVRSSVNPLASQDHVRLLTHHLQLMGEIQYIESESSDSDLIVLSPRWLCGDILGTLLSPHHLLSTSPRGGKEKGGDRGGGSLSVTDVQRMFPQADALNLVQMFEALEICTQCEVNGDVEFEFPCLNFMDPPSNLWHKEKDSSGPYQEAIYGGVRLHTSFQSGSQLKYLLPRIQVFLRRNMLEGEGDEEDRGDESDDEGGERWEGRREQLGEGEGEIEGEGQGEEVGRRRGEAAGDSRSREDRLGLHHATTEQAAEEVIGETGNEITRRCSRSSSFKGAGEKKACDHATEAVGKMGGASSSSGSKGLQHTYLQVRGLERDSGSSGGSSRSSSPKTTFRRKRRDHAITTRGGEEGTEELGERFTAVRSSFRRRKSPQPAVMRKERDHSTTAGEGGGEEEETAEERDERVAACSSSSGSKTATGGGVVGLQQWHCGSRYRWGLMEGVMVTDLHQQFLEIKVRGPQDSRYALFFFLQDFVNVVEQVVERVCPGLATERYILSPCQLQQHGHIVRSYSPTELLRMQLDQRSSLVLTGSLTESFLDVACMGCEEVLQHITLGMDQEVSQLTVHTQRLLSQLLDPPDKMGRDWCLLAVTLGLADILPALDSEGEEEEEEEEGEEDGKRGGGGGGGGSSQSNPNSPLPSPRPRVLRPFRMSQTQRVLIEWSRRNPGACVRNLLGKLRDLNRLDAVEAVLRTTPAFTTVTCDDPSTDESGLGGGVGGDVFGGGGGSGGGAAHGTDTSTNTLLSR